MAKVTRIDGKLCDDGCYNYCTDPNHHKYVFCRGSKTYDGVEKMMGIIIYSYRLLDPERSDVPPWCPLGRSNP